MFRLQRLVLCLCLTVFVGASYMNRWKNPSNCKTGIDPAGYYCDHGWKDSGLKYNQSIFERNNRHAIVLEWAKILPDVCTSKLNKNEINYYKRQLDMLLQQGIEPVVVLYAGNLPAVFGPLGGWTNPIIIQYYANYVRQAFKNFGNRVKTWITFDEPRKICDSFDGLIGDEFPSGIAEYLCVHNVLKAHAEAYHIYDREFRITQDGKISITLDMIWAEPADRSHPKHIRAAERKMQFEFGLYANPILNFDYPATVIDRVDKKSKDKGFSKSRLPQFTYDEKLRISGTYDYVGIKQKGINFIVPLESEHTSSPSTKVDCGCKTTKSIYYKSNEKWRQKQACHLMLHWIKTTYCNPEIVFIYDGAKNDGPDLEEHDSKVHKVQKMSKEYLKKVLKSVLEFDKLLKS